MALLFGLLACDLALFAWQILCFQRSADSHVRNHGGLAPVWGGQLALLFAAFTGAALWWGAFLNAGQPEATELFTDRMDREHASAYRLEVRAEGREIHFEGLITFGLIKRLAALLEENPTAKVIVLSGQGGQIYEARGATKLILAGNLDTHAKGDCLSACTLLFAAGTARSMDPGVRLGFHGYGLEGVSDLPHIDIAAEQSRDRTYFESRGATDAFLDRMFDTPQDSLWYLGVTEAQEAGLLHP